MSALQEELLVLDGPTLVAQLNNIHDSLRDPDRLLLLAEELIPSLRRLEKITAEYDAKSSDAIRAAQSSLH